MTHQEARLDLGRKERLGMVEAIWGEHKTSKQIADILRSLQLHGQLGLVTRVKPEKAYEVIDLLDNVEFDSVANCLITGKKPQINKFLGEVVLLTGGTSDMSVAYEANLALQCHGIQTDLLIDVGVAGLHRLLDQLEKLKKAKVLIAFAGMEGALPTVLAGLVPQPVIAVPVSVGYGVSKGGLAALNGMLASCAPGLVVVNIDNGYGAAMAALRILMTGRSEASIKH